MPEPSEPRTRVGLPLAGNPVEALLAHRNTVFLICLGFARHRGDAEDLAQETCPHALRRVP
jgi:DNA-directed RNA polymerase specialized sigma24 family protein